MKLQQQPARMALFVLLAAGIGGTLLAPAVQAKPGGVKAVFKSDQNLLTVRARSRDTEVVLYDDVLDQELARQQPSSGKVEFTLDHPAAVPCRVRLEGGGKVVKAAVAGSDCKGLRKPLACRITRPVGTQTIDNGGELSFEGAVKGARSHTISYEWDFGGGADARVTQTNASLPTSATGPVRFTMLRDARLWVSFTAFDITGARCADRLEVAVGSPPDAPISVPQQPAPGGAGTGESFHVVLPFTPFGMTFHDLSYQLIAQSYPINWIEAVVVKKGGTGLNKPSMATGQAVSLAFSAAASEWDPAGSQSINSTSQNYPIGSLYMDATIRKSDYFDPCLYKGKPLQPTGSDHVVNNAVCAFG